MNKTKAANINPNTVIACCVGALRDACAEPGKEEQFIDGIVRLIRGVAPSLSFKSESEV